MSPSIAPNNSTRLLRYWGCRRTSFAETLISLNDLVGAFIIIITKIDYISMF